MAAVFADQLRTLRETQARLRALIENEPECVKLVDREGRLLEMNAAGLRMIEAAAAAQVLGHCIYGLIAPEHAEAFRALTDRVCAGERGTLEFEIIGLQGTRRWLEAHAVPFRDEASGDTRLLAITRDITERRRLQHALGAEERRFRSLTELSSDWYWEQDENFRFTLITGGGRRPGRIAPPAPVHLGKTRWELPALNLSEHDWAQHRAQLERRESFHDFEIQRRQPDGSVLWASVSGEPVFDGAGKFTGYRGVGRDITDRRRAEQRLRLFMQHAPAAAWIKDASFRYSYVNPTYEAVYGRAASEVVGRDDFELHDAARARAFREEDERIRASGQAEQKMHAVPYADGRPGHWLVVKFPLEEGAVGGIGIDVTPRLEAEEKARRYAEEVRRLANRLVQAQEAERRRIAAGLHDLIGQNLTALGIDLQALKLRLQSGGDMMSGPRIEAMAGLLETTIDAIRDVMTDLHPPALEEFGLVPALRWHAAQFGKRTGMKVVTRVHGKERRLETDMELALFRIVQEALTNAAKHSGGNAIEVRIDYDEGLRLSVSDDGRGFADREGARSARRGGFGLPTMRERVEAIGGRLRIEFPGRGTRLMVEVP